MESESSCQGLRVDWRDSRGAAMVDEASRMKVVMGIVTCILLIFTVETRVLIFFGWYTLGAIILYFAYGMHNSRLAKGLDEEEGPEMGEYVAPVGEQP